MSAEDQPLSPLPEWSYDQDTCVAETPIFTLRSVRGVSAANPDHPGQFVYLDSADWVNVVAVTPDRQVVLIDQCRHGRQELTVEIPGGMVDPGEAPLGAGVRELREETGFSGKARLLGRVSPNPAILNNFCYTVLVEEARRTAAPELEAHEEIAVRLVALEEIPRLVRDGVIHHALVVAAFHHLWLEGTE